SALLHCVLLACVVLSVPAASWICALSLHDALPISLYLKNFTGSRYMGDSWEEADEEKEKEPLAFTCLLDEKEPQLKANGSFSFRSEEHTSELQSRFDLVCRLLLEKKNST